MQNGYERASKEIVPAARVVIARRLKEKYNMTETDIAKILGIAQAAVSKYLNEDYSKLVESTAHEINMDEIDRYIEKISKGDQIAVKKCICSVCNTMNDFDCSLSAVKVSSPGNRL